MVKAKGSKKKVEVTNISAKDFIALRKSPDRFVKLDDGWIRDKYLSVLTGKNYDWAPTEHEQHIPWQVGQDHAAKLGGMQPSLEELLSLIDEDKANPAIVEAAKVLGLKLDDYYWTRTTYPGDSDCARVVGFSLGYVGGTRKVNSSDVRPVRLSQ